MFVGGIKSRSIPSTVCMGFIQIVKCLSCYGNILNRHGNSSCHGSAKQLKLLWQQCHGNSSCHGDNIPSSWSRPWGGVSIQLELVRCCDGNMKSSLLVHRLNVCRALFHHRPETKCKYSSCIFRADITWYFWFGCLGQLRPHSRTAIQVQNIVNRTFHPFLTHKTTNKYERTNNNWRTSK